jgi:hypothetical protein
MGGCREEYSPQTHGYVEKNATRHSGYTKGDAVNNRGQEMVWLPERNPVS